MLSEWVICVGKNVHRTNDTVTTAIVISWIQDVISSKFVTFVTNLGAFQI